MALHRLTEVTIGVPDVEETARYCERPLRLPATPPSFLHPDDLADLMMGAHQ